MSDYIDRDKLIDAIEQMPWYSINRIGELVEGAKGEGDGLYKASDIHELINNFGNVARVRLLILDKDGVEVAHIDNVENDITSDNTTLFPTLSHFINKPKGRWVDKEIRGYVCSACGDVLPYSDEYDYQTNYCPNCGADMREGGTE